MDKAKKVRAFISLFEYFRYAETMRYWFNFHATDPTTVSEDPSQFPEVIDPRAHGDAVLGMLWSATMYVVIEGWRKLKLRDLKIDHLLESEIVDILRRFRNVTYHYQLDHIRDPRFQALMNPDRLLWKGILSQAFREFFGRQNDADSEYARWL